MCRCCSDRQCPLLPGSVSFGGSSKNPIEPVKLYLMGPLGGERA